MSDEFFYGKLISAREDIELHSNYIDFVPEN